MLIANLSLLSTEHRVVLFSTIQLLLFGYMVLPSIYGDTSIPVYGTVHSDICEMIGGEVIKLVIDMEYNESSLFCDYGDRLFRIVEPIARPCIEAIGIWVDPESGNRYELPTPCEEPKPCTDTGTWTNTHGNSAYSIVKRAELILEVDQRQFIIAARSLGSICQFEFVGADKSIDLLIKRPENISTTLNVEIPKKILDRKSTRLNSSHT